MTERSSISRTAVADWFIAKWQGRLAESGFAYIRVATQMRKQGIPLEVALPVLVSTSRCAAGIGAHTRDRLP